MSIESRSRQYGKVFDHWQIKEFLGSGSGGKTAVFRLVRSDSGWGVSALKVINLIEERGDINTLSDFQRREYEYAREECSRNAEQEVLLMDDLRGNTNIVDYLDHTFVDWSDDSGFGRDLLIRMELLKDLRSEIRSGKIFSEREVLKIGRDICGALIRCHRKNILHRDVKPENIFRNKDGDYKLGDFGVSRVLDACPGAVASTGIGTYEYWPAEQMTGRYDKRVDIYSLGLVLYELCNQNRLPFAASTYATSKEVSMRLAGEPLPQPAGASPALAKVIMKACSFDPDERYQSAEEFLKALNQVIRGIQASATSKPVSQAQKTVAHHENYATAPARETDRPNRQAKENDYKTVPASDGNHRRRGSFKTQPTQKRASYETAPARREHQQISQKKTRVKRSKILVILCGFALALIVLIGTMLGALLSNYGEKDDALLVSETTNTEPKEIISTDEIPATTITTETIQETAESVETTAPREVATEPIEMQTVYVRTAASGDVNDLFYEYNDDGTLFRFANRFGIDYTVNYYIYDDGTLVKKIDSLNSGNTDQAEWDAVKAEINGLLNYPTDSKIQYRVIVFNNERPIRQAVLNNNLEIEWNDYYSYDDRGQRTKIDTYYSESQSHTSCEYDGEGNVIRRVSYNSSSNNTMIYEIVYDQSKKVVKEIRTEFTGRSETSARDKTSFIWKNSYNSAGQLVRKDEYNAWDSTTGKYYEYNYDDYGNVIQEINNNISRAEGVSVNNMSYEKMLIPADQIDRLKSIYDYGIIGFIPINIMDSSDSTVTIEPQVEPDPDAESSTTSYKYTGKIIRTNSVNVRATPSTSAAITTSLVQGAALVIYETTIAESMAWGRCDAGWVNLYHVDLTSVANGAVDARIVYNDNTIIYSDANCNGVAGTYSRMSVVDIYEISGKMARTELGWVNTDNLL